MALDSEQYLRTIQREYLDFIDDDDDQSVYHGKIGDMIKKEKCRVIVNINDLRRKNEKRAKSLLAESFEELIAFQNALKEFVSSIDATYSKKFEEFFVGFEGSFGARHVTPRSLTSGFLGNMICVEGIVTKCSLVWPKVVRSVHYCPRTKKTLERRYTDLTSLNAFPSSTVYPTKDDDGNPLETEYGLCKFKDHQTFTIQEMPEKAPAGQLPRSVDIIVDNDLVDSCKPGDRVQVVGTFRSLPSKRGGFTSGSFRTIVIANNIKVLSKEVAPIYTARDVSKIKRLSRHKNDVFNVLANSLAPSIHGHEYIKKAVLCLLLGGTEKILENGTRLRGDINILLIGDPSTAKSQMLRYVLHSAPRAIPTTGRGSSGVGLTAAVTTDPETGDKRLEAGAMVLADRGIVCIDEFDKMSDIDRTAIHEVMEQGRVTISKAGIHAKLNARCSVLAAANPVWGRYDQFKNPMDNIGMQDSLLSRFDLLFIVLDQMDPENDRQISEHVLRMHRYRAPGEQDGEALPFGVASDTLATEDPDIVDGDTETHVYEKHDKLLHGDRSERKDKIVSLEFMRKYIHVAKIIKPALTKAAADKIANQYSELRDQETISNEKAKTMPVTARTLETMIRLSTAHAKARLSKTIDEVDADAAINMVSFAYFHKVAKKDKRKRKASEEESDEEDVNFDPKNGSRGETTHTRESKRRRKPLRKDSEEIDPYEFEDDDDGLRKPTDVVDEMKKKRQSSDRMDETTEEAVEVGTEEPLSEQRLNSFKTLLQKGFAATHVQSLSIEDVNSIVNEDSTQFSRGEIRSALNSMMEANQLMVSDDRVFLI
ncbi:zygotic DNA replication licensing factor mcm3-like [Xenia sp. Carnegie-2017]|uniref:zygotic DNA replication licensing factor mcm3-like n=1 Tax=Xenia sp. Carnegie-2017 TaxID=2897299 RepID=UPI001F03B9BB|nr:zygotic DNA replication licensing factor mcm3-like [Xenia sp. Carnegie-2017]